MNRRLLVVIDPQRAFVDPEGSLTRAHGPDEVRPGVEALGRLRDYLAQGHWAARHETDTVVFVRSEYLPGQFTGGRLDDPMAHVCVPGVSIDCEWAAGLDPAWAESTVTKRQADAGETPAYRDLLTRVVGEGVRHVVLAGFQYTTCVRASALSTMGLVGGAGIRVSVAEALTGARASSLTSTAGPSRVEQTRDELRAAGVSIIAGNPGGRP